MHLEMVKQYILCDVFNHNLKIFFFNFNEVGGGSGRGYKADE